MDVWQWRAKKQISMGLNNFLPWGGRRWRAGLTALARWPGQWGREIEGLVICFLRPWPGP
ncbi:hypothetical protein BK009_01085 [Methanobacterium subterraneum]|uniref:Uncharacterized protein n=1 Tax=Methanobacterium subterraneum TaxID=59277 RepID=A0A2H4VMS2_9EURY|nr:hypothetical protein BK009_01085 [Methanobacterium subterraneum]